MSLRAVLRHLMGSRRSVLRTLVGLLALVGVTIAFPVLQAGAVHDTGEFSMQGSIINPSPGNLPYYWSDLFACGGSPCTGSNVPAPTSLFGGGTFIQGAFVQDYVTPDTSYFTSNGGGVKDINPISTWGCKTQSNPTPKDDLLNAYVALVKMPKTALDNPNDYVLYVASERLSNNGNSFAGFWLFTSPVTCDQSTGTFVDANGNPAQHQNGDLLIVSNYTNGGSAQDVTLYEWQGGTSGGLKEISNGGVCGTSSPDQMCAIANSNTTTNPINTIGTPWPPGNTTAPAGAPYGLESSTFVEAGIDLTSVFNGNANVPCSAYFQAETRSSSELSATLKDFAATNFDTCASPTLTTSINSDGTSSVTVGGSVVDTATLSGATGTPLGTVTYNLYSDSTCTTPADLFPPVSPSTANTSSYTVMLNGDGTVPNSESVTFPNAGTTYYFQATYSGDISSGGRNSPASSACDAEPITVNRATPSLVTYPNPATGLATVGATLNDTGRLSGLVNPITGTGAGSIEFQLFSPSDAGCTISTAYPNEPVYTQTVPDTTANYPPAYSTSPGYPSDSAGVWHWVAIYSGDSNNMGTTSSCTSEPVSVNKAAPDIVTTPYTSSSPLVLSPTASFSDTAVVGGVTPGYNPAAAVTPPSNAGTVTFKLYGPFAAGTEPIDFTCTDSGAGANLLKTVPDVAATSSSATSATYPSGSYTPTAAGQYQWVAMYNGNANNATASSGCGVATEVVTVEPANPGITTTPSALSIQIGNGHGFFDTALVGAAPNPGYNPGAGTSPDGTVTFKLYGPFTTGADPSTFTCVDSGAGMNLLTTVPDVPAMLSTATSARYASGSAASPSYVPTTVGEYVWVATYNGNANNNVASTSCTDGSEMVTVTPVPPGIASTILLTDTVQVSTVTGAGALPAGGTVTFTLTGPYSGTPDCSGTVVSQQTLVPVVAGAATTPTAVPVVAGVYAWQVTYNPPAASNYDTASTSCTDEVATIAYSGSSPITPAP